MLSEYLKSKGFTEFEGNCSQLPKQVRELTLMTCKPNLKIMEIGFNAGHSAEVFLSNGCHSLISFDLCSTDYVLVAKKYIDEKYPGKHVLIKGDSRETLPMFISLNPDIRFDVIFIDGGHDYEVVKSDLENCLKLSDSSTLIIVDDVVSGDPHYQWTIGPTMVCLQAAIHEKIQVIGISDYAPGRGMMWCRC